MDLIGDYPVQVAQAALEAATMLTLALLLVLLSVRVARRSAWKPVPAIVPAMHTLRLAPTGRDEVDIPSASRALGTSLPTRAPPPPDPTQRFCPAPSGLSAG